MRENQDWAEYRPHSNSTVSEASNGMLRITLLFGSLAIAIALFLTPVLDRTDDSSLTASVIYGGIDRTATGSVRNTSRQYTIRRSILQSTPTSKCIIYSNGIKSGDC